MLFTETFPGPGGEASFLPVEIGMLAERMDVEIVPLRATSGGQVAVPRGVEVNHGLSHAIARRSTRVVCLIRSVFDARVRREVATQRPLSLRPRGLLTVVVRNARAMAVEEWLDGDLLARPDSRPALLYSWWSSSTAIGVVRAARRAGLPVIARAHGYDLFADQEVVGFVPFQSEIVRDANRVASVSRAGADYLVRLYPHSSDHVAVSYLGVPSQSRASPHPSGTSTRFVSCSTVVPVKRVGLMVDAIVLLLRDGVDVHWTHLGGGPGLSALREQVEARPELAGRVDLTGQLPPEGVAAWYRDNSVDAIVNVSASEGLPVSLMEAASFGIPMIATAVGGTPEIVDDTCGRLLPADPSVAEVARVLGDFARLPAGERDQIRDASRERWASRFSADTNYAEFGDLLASLVVR
jgi:glycosyltransferase involved in cell wall biosynthesis